MILRRVPRNEKSQLSPKSEKGGLELQCDTCGVNFWRFCSLQRLTAVTHCCSYDCSNSNDVKKKISEDACLKRFGTKNASQSSQVKEKTRLTMMKNHGVEFATLLPQFISRRNNPDAVVKQITTKKIRKTDRISLAEIRFFDRLEAASGLIVERQKVLEIWPVDGFNSDTRCYIQFDGVHWHGLDLTKEQLSKFGTQRHERSIITKRHNDAAQNAFVREQGLKLIRVSDRAFKRNADSVVMLVVDIMKQMTAGIVFVGREYDEFDEDHVTGQHYHLL